MSRRIQISLAVALLVAGGLATTFYIYQRPMAVAESAVHNLATSSNQRFKANLRLENSPAMQATLKEKGTIEVYLDGSFNRANTRPGVASAVEITIKTESVSLQLSGEARLIQDNLYLLINKTPPIWPAIQALKGQWVKMPRGGHKDTGSITPAGQIFRSVTRSGNNQYRAQATQAGVVRFMNALAEILGTELSDPQLNDLRRGIGQLEQLPVTLTITPFTHRLERLEATIAPPNGNLVHFVLEFESVTTPSVITEPEEATTLESALKKG